MCPVGVWENEKCCENTSRRLPKATEEDPKMFRAYINKSKMISFL